MTPRQALYSAVDEVLTRYEVDVGEASLVRRDSIELPAKLQYAWRHPAKPVLYVSSASGGPRVASDRNQVGAFSIGADGALRPLGAMRPLRHRAVHLCTDPAGRHVLNAHNFGGGGLTVHRLEAEGAVGAEVAQDAGLDLGIYPHQVMVFPSGRTVLVVDRGNKAQAQKPEDPGALRSFGFAEGRLSTGSVVAPQGGYGFGPRHVAFHPTRPWLYVSDERSNRLLVFRYSPEDRLDDEAALSLPTLADPEHVLPRQIAGAIHVHPNGRFVYVANRADHTVLFDGHPVFAGGENNIAVFAIDPQTGEPHLLQHADTGSCHVRTFGCDASGRLLVAASIKAMHVQEPSGALRHVPAALTTFRIADDGRLQRTGAWPVETRDGQLQYWMGMVALA